MTSVLVVNAGSTSLKLSLVDEAGESSALASLGDAPGDIAAVGHRVVHGGPAFRAPVLLDDATLTELRALVDLAPLHNAPALEAIDATRRAFPAVPQVAVFDTEFHATHARRGIHRTRCPNAGARSGIFGATAFTGSRCSGRASRCG